MKLATYTKQPRERKDYDITYGEWLGTVNDTLDLVETTVECLTDPTNASLVIDLVQNTLDTVKLWVRGGTDGAAYKVTVKVSTIGERIDESELIFKVKEI